MKPLTERQKRILEFITRFIDENGFPPTVREIGRACGMRSSSSVHGQLQKLEQMGYIKKNSAQSRAITVVLDDEEKDRTVHVPMVGLVTAGNPIEAIEEVTEYFPLPQSLVQGRDTVFMLTVSGDSMKNAGILDGDHIIVEKTNAVKNNDIVVALIDNHEATVKRFFKEKDHVRLVPENEAYDPIILKDVAIIGRVIGVYRELVWTNRNIKEKWVCLRKRHTHFFL